MLVAMALVAAVLVALLAGGFGRVATGHADDGAAPCHAQVNCVGQIANAPLGASSLPVALVAVAAVFLLVTRLDLRPVRWHDRLTAGRLFRPPRLLG
jgi:hypothetical protein